MERLVDCLGVLPDVELLLMNLTLSALEAIRLNRYRMRSGV